MNPTRWAAARPHEPAVVVQETGAVLTRGELETESNRLAHLFRSLGLKAGDHVATLLRNQVELFPIAWAAQRAGLLYTPVNWHLSPEEAAFIIDNCGAEVLVVDVAFEELLKKMRGSIPEVHHVFLVNGEGDDSLEAAAAIFPQHPIDDEAEGYPMYYSSGTTGRPKGILPKEYGQTYGTGTPLWNRMVGVFGFGEDSVFLSPGPLYHAMPLQWSMGALRHGGRLVLMERFDAAAALRAIEEHRVTHAQFVPTMFVRMLKLPASLRESTDVSSVRSIIHGAAPCPVAVKEAMIEWFGPILVEFYAGSEGNGFFSLDSHEWLEHKGSVGRPLQGQPHILGPDGQELPTGEIGEVWIGGVAPFRYHRDPEKTARVFNDRGWSTLGDLGHLDEDGYLYLSARRTDLIISGGVNIYPQEVEDTLTLHPAVRDVAVVGLVDDEYGQRVHAAIEPEEGVEPSEALVLEIKKFVRSRIAHYKAPRTVSFEIIPRLPSGKILKRELLQRHQAPEVSR